MEQAKNKIKIIFGRLIFLVTHLLPYKGVVFLNYHRIGTNDKFINLSVPFDDFCTQIVYLKKNFSLLSFDDAIEMLKIGNVNDLYFALTFDDGFKDNILAFNFLNSIDIKPALFVTVDAIAKNEIFWFQKLKIAIKEKDHFLRYFKKSSIEESLIYLKSIPLNNRQIALDDFLKSMGVNNLESLKDDIFSWDELRNLVDNNLVIIGSHGLHHESLKFFGEKEINLEIEQSKIIIEDKLGIKVNTYAFPNGGKEDIPKEAKNVLKESGYEYAFSLISGINNALSFNMNRICISEQFYQFKSNFNKDLFFFNFTKNLIL